MDFSRTKLAFGDDAKNNPNAEPARVLCFGEAKTRKTLWALTAGETHNVFVLDGENGTGIGRLLPNKIISNISRIPLATDPNPEAVSMATFLTAMFEQKQFIYDKNKHRIVKMVEAAKSSDTSYLVVDLMSLTKNDVLIIDSWTQLVKDITAAYRIEQGINAFEGIITNSNNKFHFFGYANIVLDNILEGINKLPCHVIIIAHEDTYKKEVHDGPVKKEITVTQVLSSSGNQAAKIPGGVGDILYFAHDKSIANTSIVHTGNGKNRVGGGRRVSAAQHKFPIKIDNNDVENANLGWTWKDYCAEGFIPAGNIRPPNELPPIALLLGSEIKQLMEGANNSNVINK